MRVWTFEWMEGETGKQVQYTDEELAALDPAKDDLGYLEARRRAIAYFKASENVNLSNLVGQVAFRCEFTDEDFTPTVKSWA